MLRVAFVYAPIGHQSFEENLRVVDEDFGRLPPISLAYAAAIAQAAGHEVMLLDANAEALTIEQAIERLRIFAPQVIGFSLSTYMFDRTTLWMRRLGEALSVPTIAGGVNLRLYPKETLMAKGVDYGVLHYGLRGLPLLLEAIEKGQCAAGLPEVVARNDQGEIVIGLVNELSNPYPSLPEPARHLLANHLYYSIISQRRNFTVMVTGTGCKFSCRYCAIAPVPRFANPIPRVLEEIQHCVDQFGIHEIDFFDADFFADRARAEQICKELIKAKLDLEWSCRSRIDVLSKPLLELAYRAGCRKIYVGIETPNKDALRVMQKRINTSKVRETLLQMQEIGIRPLGFFMIGVPNETHATALSTIRYAMSLPLDYAQFSRMIAKPGSGLHSDEVEATGCDYWQSWVLGKEVPSRLPNRESVISEEAILFYTKLAYLAFYYRPRMVVRALSRMKSRDEIQRSARTALRMLRGLTDSDTR